MKTIAIVGGILGGVALLYLLLRPKDSSLIAVGQPVSVEKPSSSWAQDAGYLIHESVGAIKEIVSLFD